MWSVRAPTPTRWQQLSQQATKAEQGKETAFKNMLWAQQMQSLSQGQEQAQNLSELCKQ